MGKIIRRTLTITITETWTIVWEDGPPVTPVASSSVLAQPLVDSIAQGQPDERPVNERCATLPANAPALDGKRADGVPADPAAGSKTRRTSRRRAAGSTQPSD